MAFTFKGYKKAQASRAVVKDPAQKAQSTAAPTVKAGPKNSQGPKGGSNKSTVKVTTKIVGQSKFPKVAKVTKAKLNPFKGGANPSMPHAKSGRLNYTKLKG